nr:hypothetical protein [Tanacetum cinerariifolium]
MMKRNKTFCPLIKGSFIMRLNVNIVAWNHFVNEMLFDLIKNLYVSFGIPFDPKRYYKDGDCARMLRRPSVSIYKYVLSALRTECLEINNLFTNLVNFTDMALPPRDQRHHYLRDRVCLLTELRGDYLIIEAHCLSWEELGAESAMQIPDKGDLRDYWIGISSAGDSLAPEKVTMTGLFYLRGMDIGLVNVPYLLPRYLRLFASGRKQRAMISRSLGLERRPDDAAGSPGAAEDALVVDDCVQAIPAPVQAPQPPRAARTIPHRMARLEEDVHKIHRVLAEQREVIDAMARDFSIFTVWAAGGITHLLDSTKASYTPYFVTHIPYQRRIRRRTNNASTFTAQQDPHQPDL